MSFSENSTDASGTQSLHRSMKTREKEIMDSKCGHMYMGAGGFTRKHGVGILLNERWKRKIIQTEYVSERMITTTLQCHQRKIEITSVYFLHSGHAARTGQSNKRGFWMKQWLGSQNVVALR